MGKYGRLFILKPIGKYDRLFILEPIGKYGRLFILEPIDKYCLFICTRVCKQPPRQP